METILPKETTEEFSCRVRRFLIDAGCWVVGMRVTCPELVSLYRVYVSLVILIRLREVSGKCNTCLVCPTEFAGSVCIPAQCPEGELGFGNPVVVIEGVLRELEAGGVVQSMETEREDIRHFLRMTGDSLEQCMRNIMLSAVAIMAQAEITRNRAASHRTPSHYTVKQSEERIAVLTRLVAKPNEWLVCPEVQAAHELANGGHIERDDFGRYRVVDVEKARRQIDFHRQAIANG